jgi:hypothetical protein
MGQGFLNFDKECCIPAQCEGFVYFVDVKKWMPTFLLLAAVVLFGWGQQSGHGTVAVAEKATAHSNEDQQRVASVTFFCHPLHIESIATNQAHTPSPTLKKTVQAFDLQGYGYTHVLISHFNAYVHFAQRLLYCIPLTDFIFPFHHFW